VTNNHDRILDWVNYIRELIGLPKVDKLSKGIQKDPYCCPIAASIKEGNNKVVVRQESFKTEAYMLGEDNEVVSKVYKITPEAVKTFVQNFDDGIYPDLIESNSDENENR
jgi:hypothetical protein